MTRVRSGDTPQSLARSLYGALQAQGYAPMQILQVANELLGHVTAELEPPAAHEHDLMTQMKEKETE